MLEITFIEDYGFAEDGIRTTHFKAGETRLVSRSCADSAVQCGVARVGTAKHVPAAPENKALAAPGTANKAPQTKSTPKSKAAKQPV